MASAPSEALAWHDGPESDALDETLRKALEGRPEPMPVTCPLCEHASVHAYFHARPEGRLGGCWVWCSHCRACSHFSAWAPPWWANLEAIEETLLTAMPHALEPVASRIDAHWNALRKVTPRG